MKRKNFLVSLGGIAGGLTAYPLFSFKRPDSASQSLLNNDLINQPSSRSEIMKRIGIPLKIQPVFLYDLPVRREATSYRPWGGIIEQEDVNNEVIRIQEELKKLESHADFPVSLNPLLEVNSDDKARIACESDSDVILLYAAGNGRDRIDMMTNSGKDVVMFLRHQSGPVYLWYEIVHPRLLRKESDEYVYPNFDIEDVVVDDYNLVLVRLRALYGLKNIRNTTILAINGVGGWGGLTDNAKKAINEIWHLKTPTAEMTELTSLVEKKLNDSSEMKRAEDDMKEYLSDKYILSVNAKREYILNGFILYHALKDMMKKYDAEGVTIRGCMGIGPHVKTTACLPFSLINDEGLMAFCESDFVVIPSGVLMRYISGKPSFLNDPTLPHHGITTCAHCTAPRRMDGTNLEPAHVYTHFESDYGSTPKVEFHKGQVITNIIPDFNSKKWVGFSGVITDHPFYKICRSQFDCTIEGDWKKLLKDMRGFHWMTCYGDYLQEIAYATKKAGIEFENISEQV